MFEDENVEDCSVEALSSIISEVRESENVRLNISLKRLLEFVAKKNNMYYKTLADELIFKGLMENLNIYFKKPSHNVNEGCNGLGEYSVDISFGELMSILTGDDFSCFSSKSNDKVINLLNLKKLPSISFI